MATRPMLLLLLLPLCGCGATAPVSRAPEHEHLAVAAVDEESASPIAPSSSGGSTEAPLGPEPGDATGEERLEVNSPADLRAAVMAIRPTIELVPRSCLPWETVANGDRACVMDARTGLPRAVRRYALGGDPIQAVRLGDEMLLAVPTDMNGVRTRFDGGLWRWDLRRDEHEVLVARPGPRGDFFRPDLIATRWGVIVVDEGWGRQWLYADGALRRLHPIAAPASLDDIYSFQGRSFLFGRRGQREEIHELIVEGTHVRFERRVSYPRAWHLPLADAFLAGQAIAASLVPRGEDASELFLADIDAGTTRSVMVPVGRPREIRVVEGALEVRTPDEDVRLDLRTGQILGRVPHRAEPEAQPSRNPVRRGLASAFARLLPTAEGLLVEAGGRFFALGVAGLRVLPNEGDAYDPDIHVAEELHAALADRTGSRCRCDGELLHCVGAAPVPDACALSRASGVLIVGGEPVPSHAFLWGGTVRLDVVDADLVRLTRLGDGARLWLRMISTSSASWLLAQTDDGAFWVEDGAETGALVVRWGSSILDAPVTELGPHAAALRRDTLLTDFLAGRPLPRAELPRPSELAPAP